MAWYYIVTGEISRDSSTRRPRVTGRKGLPWITSIIISSLAIMSPASTILRSSLTWMISEDCSLRILVLANGMPTQHFVPRTFPRLRGNDYESQNRICIVAGVGNSSSRKIFTRCRQDCRPTFVVGFYWPLFRKTSEHNRKPEQKADNHCSQAADQLWLFWRLFHRNREG